MYLGGIPEYILSDVTVMVGIAYLLTYLLYGRLVLWRQWAFLPQVMKTGVWAVMSSRVTHHLFTLLPLADEHVSSANRQILPVRSINL